MDTQRRLRLHAAVSALIERLADGSRDDPARDGLLAEVLAFQQQRVSVYDQFLRQWPAGHSGGCPALPTDVFRYARVAGHEPALDVRVFRTSGTTSGARGAHFFCDMSLYDRAARAAAGFALFPEGQRLRLIVLAPAPKEAPDSSLSYMLGRFVRWFGADSSRFVWRGGALQLPELVAALHEAVAEGAPAALLGTSFAFVHAEDGLGSTRFRLPPGSRIMQTGGFKGRSREIDPEAMGGLLAARYGVPSAACAQEYGMTELSSQMYSAGLRSHLLEGSASVDSTAARLWVPGWVRAQPVDPETLQPVAPGAVGILRIDDLANLDSVSALQTADLAYAVAPDQIVLVGRQPGAIVRGCSLAVEEALS